MIFRAKTPLKKFYLISTLSQHGEVDQQEDENCEEYGGPPLLLPPLERRQKSELDVAHLQGCKFYPDGSIFCTRADKLTSSACPTHQNFPKFNTGRVKYLYPGHKFDGLDGSGQTGHLTRCSLTLKKPLKAFHGLSSFLITRRC